MSDLSQLGAEYIKICQELKEVNEKLKAQKDKKKALNDKIVELMSENGKAELALSGGTIKLDKKNKPEGVNKKSILTAICDKYNGTVADDIADMVMKNRPKKESRSLKLDI